VPSLVCIADRVAKLRARQLPRNRHIVAHTAKLLSLNAKIVSRLNSLILADRGLKCVPYMETGCEESKSALGIGTGSSFGHHFGEKTENRRFPQSSISVAIGHAKSILGAVT